MSNDVRVTTKIKLHCANMIVGLDGWGNAGKVSTFTIKYLLDKLGAQSFGEIPIEFFHNYLIHRPIVSIKEGLIHSYIPPKNALYYWKDETGKSCLILLLGHEPHTNWPRFVEAMLSVAEQSGVKRIYTIGGYLADPSYASDSPITSSTNNEHVVSELKKIRVELTNYTGPTSVYSELLWRAKEKNVDVVSLWSAVPMYVSGIYPKAAYNILQKITQLINVKLDLTDLKNKAEAFERQLRREIAGRSAEGLIESFRERGSREKKPTYIL